MRKCSAVAAEAAWYDDGRSIERRRTGRMRTVIVRGQSPLPDALRDVVERGSTSVQECRVPGPTPLPRDVDRVVYFLAGPDPDVLASARQALSSEQRDHAEKLVYVMGDGA